jgi:hypothetical protein
MTCAEFGYLVIFIGMDEVVKNDIIDSAVTGKSLLDDNVLIEDLVKVGRGNLTESKTLFGYIDDNFVSFFAFGGRSGGKLEGIDKICGLGIKEAFGKPANYAWSDHTYKQ